MSYNFFNTIYIFRYPGLFIVFFSFLPKTTEIGENTRKSICCRGKFNETWQEGRRRFSFPFVRFLLFLAPYYSCVTVVVAVPLVHNTRIFTIYTIHIYIYTHTRSHPTLDNSGRNDIKQLEIFWTAASRQYSIRAQPVKSLKL